ncbi:glutamyl endopeptidase-like isoform X2 [Haliotis rubra]|uniref:glutamyl endopeptidase-like isoform X2 n=1 Tax=Haliotis rubra TaxID=36100 RepID=UPI001EE592C1|nr:glutamyl endopeptidase-like isoform X2 [Haliotis rubra]
METHRHKGLHQKVFTPPGDQRNKVDRPSDGPYCAIAHLSLYYGLTKYAGTGFLFKREALGKERFLVLTAGHNLYDVGRKRFADAVVIRFGRNGPFNLGEIIKKSDDFRVPTQFIQGQQEYDFGMILLDVSTDPIPCEHAFQPMLYTDDDSVFANVFMSGYPRRPTGGKEGTPGYPRGTQWELDVQLERMTDYHFLYRDATTDGNSGSPVYWKIPDLNQYVALGIHVTGGDSTGEY